MAARLPIIGVSLGDPFGIGPEVVLKALSDSALRQRAQFHVYGSNTLLTEAAQRLGIHPYWWRVDYGSDRLQLPLHQDVVVIDHPELDDRLIPPAAGPGPSRIGGLASLLYLNHAIAASKHVSGAPTRLDALVTAPVCKESWVLAGVSKYPGHTELLADALGASRYAMMFVAPQIMVALATIHVPLMQVRNLLTLGQVLTPIELADAACRRWFKLDKPRVAVCGLNPHASENGLFGDEERRVIAPAIEQARKAGIDASGPYPADTIYNAAVGLSPADRRFDVVVAMYHDQGLIPVKLLARDFAVNVTLGLPVPRTSPDHGTAFDIAGQGVADAGSMKSALELAVTMAQHRATSRDTASPLRPVRPSSV